MVAVELWHICCFYFHKFGTEVTIDEGTDDLLLIILIVHILSSSAADNL